MTDSGQTRLRRDAMAQFERLIDLDADARAAELHKLADADAALHAQVRRLLDADRAAEAGGFLGDGAEARLRSLGGFVETEAVTLQAGAAFGPYRLEHPLGSGGMGEVWLASRVDGLYEGKVAIKTLRAFLVQPGARERFAREGRILGRLQHPNIARLLDAGVTDDGQLYLVLEYVAGAHLTAWCDAQNLSIAARLQLFLRICEAVAHAHAQLVVHRDLKPSNILVAASGEPKLLDFGIAKLIEGEAGSDTASGAQTELTRLGGRALTPEYAAPEQILGEPVSTATDVYALGVLLYELLCGLRPHSGNGVTALQLERAVIETDARPLTQSTLRRESSERSTPAQRAARRGLTPRSLRKALAGDLDNIVLKALRRVPAQRYASVSAFADDLRRHLAHEPISAQRDALGYRAGKFLRRYRGGLAAAAAVVVALSAGLGFSLWQAQVARTQAQKAEAVKNFLLAIFEQNRVNHPDGAQARTTTAAQLLDVGAQRIRDELHDVPEVRTELLSTLGTLYYGLMLPEPALALQREAVEILSRAFGDDDSRTVEARVRLGASLIESAALYDEGSAMLKTALAQLDAGGQGQLRIAAFAAYHLGQWAYYTLPADDPAARQYFQRALDTYRALGHSAGEQILCWQGLAHAAEYSGDLAAAEHGYRQSLELAKDAPTRRVDIAGSYQQFGDLLRKQYRYAEAEAKLREAVRLFDEAVGPAHPLTIDARRELGKHLSAAGKRAEGLAMLADVVRDQTRVRGADDPAMTAVARFDYANALFAYGRFEEAAEQFERTLAVRRAEAAQSPHLAITLSRYGYVLLMLGRLDQAEALSDEAVAMIQAVYGSNSGSLATARVRRAQLWLARGDAARAAAESAAVLEAWPSASGDPPVHWVAAQLALVDALLVLGRSAEARLHAQALVSRIASPEAAEATTARRPEEEARAQLGLGRALLQSGDAAAAIAPLTRAVRLRESGDDPDSPWLAQARTALAQAQADVRQAHVAGSDSSSKRK